MEKKLLENAMKYLHELERAREIQTQRMEEIRECEGLLLQRKRLDSNREYYYVRKQGEHSFKYLGKADNEDVKCIKEYRYLRQSLKDIESNIMQVKDLLSNIRPTDFESVRSGLPAVYREVTINATNASDESKRWKESSEALKQRCGVYMPEELKVKTSDGKRVRSKSEAMIYNYLLSQGVTFVYELPLRLGNSNIFPDFTLLSEKDHKTELIIEHQGLMNSDHYRRRFSDKLYSYYRAGFVQGVNIFFTFDSPDGGLDMTPIEDIVMKALT